jgi:hypothetical protein
MVLLVDGVLGFFSCRPNFDSPTPSPAGENMSPPFGSGGGGVYTLACGRGGGPNSNEGTDTVVLEYDLGIYIESVFPA